MGLGGYTLATIAFLKKGAPGIERVGFDAAHLPRAVVGPLHRLRADTEQAAGPVFTVPHKAPEPHYCLTIGHIETPGADGGPPTPAGHVLRPRNESDFKKLDQLKSKFLATISHELKTPLASVNLSLFLLQDERTDPKECQRIAAGIRDGTQRLLGMVGQLIDVSRLDAGAGIQLNVRALALADAVA